MKLKAKIDGRRTIGLLSSVPGHRSSLRRLFLSACDFQLSTNLYLLLITPGTGVGQGGDAGTEGVMRQQDAVDGV